jgi:hypothetical protein
MQNEASAGFSFPQFEQLITKDAIPRSHADASGRQFRSLNEPGCLSNRATFWATSRI